MYARCMVGILFILFLMILGNCQKFHQFVKFLFWFYFDLVQDHSNFHSKIMGQKLLDIFGLVPKWPITGAGAAVNKNHTTTIIPNHFFLKHATFQQLLPAVVRSFCSIKPCLNTCSLIRLLISACTMQTVLSLLISKVDSFSFIYIPAYTGAHTHTRVTHTNWTDLPTTLTYTRKIFIIYVYKFYKLELARTTLFVPANFKFYAVL